MLKTDRITIGITAPVDAGKTTLSEALLYHAGSIRQAGRVDHQNAFLDTHSLEKQRGITIFSKQALFELGERSITLLDTPGHMDFSAEMERTLQVLDYAVLLISAADGVTGYVNTLWGLLSEYEIPVFIFVNKMDQPGADRQKLMEMLREKLDERCLVPEPAYYEDIAVSDEQAMEEYLETGTITENRLSKLIKHRKLFPVYFGSALKMEGTEQFIDALDRFMISPEYDEKFGARVYKISRDAQGNRMTHMKITGGSIRAKQLIPECSEKVQQIRIYQGAKFTEIQEAPAGTVCAVTGLGGTYCGQGLGSEKELYSPVMSPVLSYSVILPEGFDVHDAFVKLSQLAEEDPQLHIELNREPGEICVKLMGRVQTEILKSLVAERFGIDIEFGEGNVVYMETVQQVSEGVGHYEPLRHYSEVHLVLEPLERGSGVIFDTDVSEDLLDRNWQRLILTHLCEKKHRGVLIGAEITDMKITLAAGRAHEKHTEGGDFRQSTYRAVRQGLMRNKCIVLEPFYSYSLEIPQEMTGRAISDIQRMAGTFNEPEITGDMTVIRGRAPVSTMNGYYTEVLSYTRGTGRLYCSFSGYDVCHNQEEVIAAAGYNPEADLDNPPGSVFCSHGAGFNVPWNEVEQYMHIKSVLQKTPAADAGAVRSISDRSVVFDDELKAIFEKTYGKRKEKSKPYVRKSERQYSSDYKARKPYDPDRKKYLVIDGYNMIFSWDDIDSDNIGFARERLLDIISDYGSSTDAEIILVFDGYKVKGNNGTAEDINGISVVYTRENQTADSYIEKLAYELGKKADVTVATSDYMEQLMIFGSGAKRITSAELKADIENAKEKIRSSINRTGNDKNYLLAELLKEVNDKEAD